MTALCDCSDCCSGVRPLTPADVFNRPGLARLSARVGTHASFFETMLARLSAYPKLDELRTRQLDDASIALLDAWAVIGDVLTFYQERLVNEGYLRTATERRSVLELARLIGYRLRPGVAASVHLAYVLEKDSGPVELPAGTRASSVPGPGEQLQTFETAEPLNARFEWNELEPRLTLPQTADSVKARGLYVKGTGSKLKANDPLLVDLGDGKLEFVFVQAVELDHEHDLTRLVLRGLGPEPLSEDKLKAIVQKFAAVDDFDVSGTSATAKRVLAILKRLSALAARSAELAAYLDGEGLPKLEAELKKARESQFTKLAPWIDGLIRELQANRAGPAGPAGIDRAKDAPALPAAQGHGFASVIDALDKAPSRPPANARRLKRDVNATFAKHADSLPRLLGSLRPSLGKTLYARMKSAPPAGDGEVKAYALRVAAAPFGHNAPLRVTGVRGNKPTFAEWTIDDPYNSSADGDEFVEAAKTTIETHASNRIFLDNDYDVKPDTFVVIEKSNGDTLIVPEADAIVHRSYAGYGMSGKTVQIDLPDKTNWLADGSTDFSQIRKARVFAGSEALPLAEAPLADPIEGGTLELADVYEGLEPGRWLIVSGERRDIPAAGVTASELVMLGGIEQTTRTDGAGKPVTGDRIHTYLRLAESLAYTYERSTVKVYGNVVRATHGETRTEVLGSGDATRELQAFTLKQPPLTYVSAPTPSGLESTLEVRVNDVAWREIESLALLEPDARGFVTRTDDAAKTTVVFGTGARGARLPTGVENVRATYRNGIGAGGNVRPGQISLPTDRPLGVREVTNPMRASGGADQDALEDARENAPLPLVCLDRLVSLQDYADFSRTFAGVGKATASRLSDGRRELVHVTIAGVGDIPIDDTSDLFRNLLVALRRSGDPNVPIRLGVRRRLGLVVSAKVRLAADYAWEFVEPKLRGALLTRFGFGRVELGEDLLLSDAIATIQGVPGVAYADVETFDAVSESELLSAFDPGNPARFTLGRSERVRVEPARLENELLPAEVAYLAPDVADTLLLEELKS